MGSSISKLYTKTKEKIKNNPIASTLLFSTSAIALALYMNPPPKEILLSRFLMLLKNEAVEECVVSGTTIFFTGVDSEVWHQVNVSMLSQDMLFKLLLGRKDLIVSSQDPVDIGNFVALLGGKDLVLLF